MALSRKKRKKNIADDEQARLHRRQHGGDKPDMLTLQHSIGNQAVQRLLAQRQAGAPQQAPNQTNQQDPNTPVPVGQVKIEKPVIEEYEVSGNSLRDVSNQLQPPDQWYEYDYQYNPKLENGVVTQIDVTVMITIHLPRWAGGWDETPDEDKIAWFQMLPMLTGETDEYEGLTELPHQWLGIDWKIAPEALKGEWLKIQQEMQAQETGPIDVARRRVIVLQQRLFKRPEDKVQEIFNRFQEDLKIEEEAYNEQREFGQPQQIALEPDALIQ